VVCLGNMCKATLHKGDNDAIIIIIIIIIICLSSTLAIVEVTLPLTLGGRGGTHHLVFIILYKIT